jgi:hypothetical protein
MCYSWVVCIMRKRAGARASTRVGPAKIGGTSGTADPASPVRPGRAAGRKLRSACACGGFRRRPAGQFAENSRRSFRRARRESLPSGSPPSSPRGTGEAGVQWVFENIPVTKGDRGMNTRRQEPNGAAETAAEARAYRKIPLEVLRGFYSDQVELSSLTQVAARIGVGKSTLHGFLTGAKPHRRTLRFLGLHYLKARDTSPQSEALQCIAGNDEELRGAVLDTLAAHLQRRARPIPEWLSQMRASR